MERAISLVGLLTMIFICYLLSTNRKAVKWKTVWVGVLLQLTFAVLILKTTPGVRLFEYMNDGFTAVLNFTNAGSRFMFGELSNSAKFGWVFATMVLPTIIFVGALMGILYHVGIMQKVVGWTAKIMMKTMGTSGTESLASAVNIFVGQTEAPLVIRPYVNSMTRSELLALMVGGMANVAGGVLAAYVGMGIEAGHLIAGSVMSAPASLVCAKLLLPEEEISPTAGVTKMELPQLSVNVIDAAATGASEGLQLALNVAGMLIAFIALVAMFNGILGWAGSLIGYPQLSFQLIMSYFFAPIAFIMGVPWQDVLPVGSLLGSKIVLNEFVAYTELQGMLSTLAPRSITIATYALCGFANFASIAIQVGGIGSLAPERRGDLSRLGIKALIGGTMSTFMTASIAGMLI